MAIYDPGVNSGRSKPLLNPYALSKPKESGFTFDLGTIGEVLEAPFELGANFAKDVGQASLGFFPGLYKLATDPLATGEAIAKSYQHSYGDLFGAYNKFTQGDFGGAAGEFKDFGEKFYEHPLGYVLDAATVATVGAGAAVRVPALLSKAGIAGKVSKPVTIKNVAAELMADATKQVGPLGAETLARKRALKLMKEDPEAAKALVSVDTGGLLNRLAQAGQREQLTRIDRPGATGRLSAFERDKRGNPLDASSTRNIARQDQYFWTSRNPFTRGRQKWMHSLSEKMASGGGRFGTIPAQMAYERAWLGTLAGNIAALEYMWGDVARLQKAMDADGTNPQQRATFNREYLEHNYENAYAKAELVPVEDWVNGKINTRVYKLLTQKSAVMGKQKSGRALYAGDTDQIITNFEQLGKFLTTTNLKKADIEMIDNVPHVRLMNRTNAAKLGLEAKNTTNFAMKAYFKSTSMWKAIVLGLAPRFVFNNVVGGSLMHLADNMGSHAIFGLYEGWKHTYGKERAGFLLERAVKENGYLNKRQDWLQNEYGDQLGQGFYYSAGQHRTPSGRESTGARMRGDTQGRQLSPDNIITKAANPAFSFTSKAERYLRASAIVSNVRSHPIVQAEMRRLQKYPRWRKAKREELFNHVAAWAHKEHPEIRKQVAQDVEQTMGNYAMLTGPERKLRAVDPFYLWQRHIVKHGTHMAMDRPGRTDLGQQLGMVGAAWAEEELGGEIPDFMQALVPFGDVQGGRHLAVSTQGMNPYSTVGELATAAAGLMPGGDVEGLKTPGEGLGPLMNPFLAAGIEEVTGTSLLTGQPRYTEQGGLQGFFNSLGPIGAVAGSPIARLPQVTAIENSLFPQEYKDPTLYSKSPGEYISALLGIPYKWVNLEAAQKLSRQQDTRRGVEK